MENIIYSNVYKEVLCVINNLIIDDYKKIPKEYIDFLEENSNKNYSFKYDINKNFEEQKISKEAKYILFCLFEKYGATQKQKKR